MFSHVLLSRSLSLGRVLGEGGLGERRFDLWGALIPWNVVSSQAARLRGVELDHRGLLHKRLARLLLARRVVHHHARRLDLGRDLRAFDRRGGEAVVAPLRLSLRGLRSEDDEAAAAVGLHAVWSA